MEYKLFDEYITLQALLKELSIIHSGGAIKGFLANNTVLFRIIKRNKRHIRQKKAIKLNENPFVSQEPNYVARKY